MPLCRALTRGRYSRIVGVSIRFQAYTAIWKCWAPLVCKLFMWLAVQYRFWMADRRLHHGLQNQRSPCYLCNQEEDTVDHITMQCVFARQVWYIRFCRMSINPDLCPTQHSTISDWWNTTRKHIPKRQRKGFDSVVTSICWNIWKQRNGRVFGRIDLRNVGGTVDLIWQELELWFRAGATGVSTWCG